MIRVENITYSRNGKDILKDVSWNVKKGEHWCLLGLNGSGKTTLLNIINGYIWPMKGKVKVLGHLFGETNIPELRKEIGWVSTSFQQKINETDTVLEVVLSGKFASIGLYEHVKNEEIDKARNLLEMLNCEALQFQNYGVISQGERQRVLIARALMASPKLLILDEPCTGLDLIAREQLLTYIEKLAKNPTGPTLIYVTHHVEEILPCFTHTLLMREGEVFAQGTSEQMLSEEKLSTFFEQPVSIQKQQDRTWIALKECNVK